jgi:hypothetical protein
MFYDKQNEEQKQQYRELLQAIGRLSRLFSEAKEPYLVSRLQENIFCKCFGLVNNSRRDDSADAYTEDGIGIGLKTWVGQDDQKIAEFGKLRPNYANLTGLELVQEIAKYRNKRIDVTKRIHNLHKMLYHVVKRVGVAMCIYETNCDNIDIENIVIDEKRGKDNNIYFSDGLHQYHFSLSKNTLYMLFDNMKLLETVQIDIVENPYDILLTTTSMGAKEQKPEKNQICLRLYTTRHGEKEIELHSGLNQWNGARKTYKKDKITGEKQLVKETPRNKDECYISYPIEDRARKDFFPPKDTSFQLLLPNRQWLSAKICQQGGKAIMSNPNNELGKWLLRDVLQILYGEIVSYQHLQEAGYDSVIFTKLADGIYSAEFCPLGTYERFYGIYDDSE